MYKHRNINASGTKFLKEFIDKYYINCMPKEKDKLNEKWIDGDIEKFKRLLNSFSDEYVFKNNYEVMRKEYLQIKKEKENGFQDYLLQEKKRIQDNMEYRLDLYKMQLESQFKNRINDLEKEIEKQKSINEKWKAMFTEQAMANAKLINKEEN